MLEELKQRMSEYSLFHALITQDIKELLKHLSLRGTVLNRFAYL